LRRSAAEPAGSYSKNTPPEELVRAVRIVAGGDALLAPSITRRMIEEYSRRPARPKTDPRLEQLTERELEVLRLLATGKSNAELAAQLYLGEGTIKTHVSHLLAKLDLRDRVQAVVFAYENGLVERPQGRLRSTDRRPEHPQTTRSCARVGKRFSRRALAGQTRPAAAGRRTRWRLLERCNVS